MKLLYSSTSPYARKVRITAFETGLHDRIELVPIDTTNPASGLSAHNPLSKIPVLETEFGPLYDSPVICEYLDSLHDGPKLFPAAGSARWNALRWQALADGLLDAALLIRHESIRPVEYQFEPYIEKQKGKILGALDAMEKGAADLEGRLTIGTITAACALGYLDLRFTDLAWRESYPNLAKWHKAFAARSSYVDTLAKA
ncbi:glutathione S-transferase family protein [Beijerinckia indica]|uniref:Glutathione S-transferase domain n=1 Tax=Beijerinckia indica subsp. indica (strain ATCC 9039 / DSM 1715 / NCIMB 8712) TaxID=395963 RepID=B2IGM6_BEII9|nr:glutathione S-transferase [Beijerinckia indica]ACB95787.1 Glutathione S-transferase domain [Beijerinckia indica subsp. indica ATCC 9039]